MWPSIPRALGSAGFRSRASLSPLPPLARAGGSGAVHAGVPGWPAHWAALEAADPALAGALRKALAPPYAQTWEQARLRADKPERQWALVLQGGEPGLIARPRPEDAPGLASFLRQTLTGLVIPSRDIADLVERVRDVLWMAAALRVDAFVLRARGQVLALAQIEPALGEPCELPLDSGWLAAQGVSPEDVCISRTHLAREFRGQGIGQLLQGAALAAAGDAGYRALAVQAGAIGGLDGPAPALRSGGQAGEVSVGGWCLVPTPVSAAGTSKGLG